AYCGEFGVIEASSIESNARWHRDVIEILKELNIGRAVWSYKEMSFPMVKADGRVVSEELIKVVSESN
ncbi:MAG: glycoside hydrolase family 5 protein, partial [Bacillota bacterium]|nr:glycoside hydrolase family 5 protein [Bacillota bacterium]